MRGHAERVDVPASPQVDDGDLMARAAIGPVPPVSVDRHEGFGVMRGDCQLVHPRGEPAQDVHRCESHRVEEQEPIAHLVNGDQPGIPGRQVRPRLGQLLDLPQEGQDFRGNRVRLLLG